MSSSPTPILVGMSELGFGRGVVKSDVVAAVSAAMAVVDVSVAAAVAERLVPLASFPLWQSLTTYYYQR